ncbi:Fms-interacting protein-domain-containing protein [Pisolithus orientalis]|uniref:Fms-interacting protein-domain-containing protein n=1 Tax=Pisolithus orientalis TaxID=936130 RepID=UPI0022248B5B|nr:Fms-interacting protein-domain-containing protein [Pisolithus orientalis]KAI6035389.1 Fms-interacting protein-domain-containing protein [Pisolithus orientalis]
MAANDDPAIDKLRQLVAPSNASVDPTTVRVQATALVARLKALNRNANAATRAHKQATTEARQEMDQTHLGLQNLLYEKRHLEREIEKCRQFASIYQDVPLHSLEEFQQIAPPEARTEDVLDNPHQLMLNRLSFELAERQRLDLKRKELVLLKEELLKQSKVKSTTVDSVKSQIDALMKTATEIQRRVDELVPPLPPSADPTSAPG